MEGQKTYGGLYSPREARRVLEERYGEENVTSTTVPPATHRSVRTRSVAYDGRMIGFDERGLVNLDSVCIFKARVPLGLTPEQEMTFATKQLRDLLNGSNSINGYVFSAEQLAAIHRGDKKIPGLTQHHHIGTEIQLVYERAHMTATPHIGSRTLREGR
jgi:hypothetical protein